MIDQLTIDRIIAAADVVDVIKDFVSLKKRGLNYIGLCPFHNEKTPSFSVSPSKGIFKCFGCSKGGNVVNFIMDHEQLSYVEALKYLAKKYNIEVEEREQTAEDLRQKNERESLMVVTAWAQRYFSDILHKHTEGKSIGLSYLRERAIREDIIDRFQLGYCLSQRDAMTQAALREGYKQEYLVKSGVSIGRDDGGAFDRFQGRVIFPIHSLSGRVIGFGGRIMTADKKMAKYVNSPESDIYHKSQILYGIFHAKKSITHENKCFLVEGYTDVISMHQSGIENVVASSGTALTVEQIRLIKRFTPNITVIYDGDPAGIKASLRGIDLILEEGLNVKVVLMPDGEDPDSFAKSHSSSEVLNFIAANETDFIHFKTKLLLETAKTDPIQRANLISDVVRTIAIIPDSIIRTVYINECTKILDVDEAVLYSEIAKHRRKRMENVMGKLQAGEALEISRPQTPVIPGFVKEIFCEEQEKEILYFLLKHGAEPFFEIPNPANENEVHVVHVGQHIITEILSDDLEFKNLIYKKIFDEYKRLMEINPEVDSRIFLNHSDGEISHVAVDLLSSPHTLSKIWAKHHSYTAEEEDFLSNAIPKTILVYKSKVMQIAIQKLNNELKHLDPATQPDDITNILSRMVTLNDLKKKIFTELDRIII